MKKAFTLVETLVCIGIISIVAALTFPVFASAKHAAKIRVSSSNLHQIHLAMKLYQMDHDGDGNYGTLEQMGLPSGIGFLLSRFGTPESLWQSPCGQNPAWFDRPAVIQYDYMPENGLDSFPSISPIYRENLIMFDDMNCANKGEPMYSDFIRHRGLGVLLSGQLLNLNKVGDSRRQLWWSPPEDN